ncbi:hypothetical protein AA23498_0752 [Acetobacter nitrogenifigens DSM 23921 = NBRC 105050]|nr:hypothetical protein AA23498_0752 [Acetobacter nitrogenifigens DSM 23921 = NBRC 105050]
MQADPADGGKDQRNAEEGYANLNEALSGCPAGLFSRIDNLVRGQESGFLSLGRLLLTGGAMDVSRRQSIHNRAMRHAVVNTAALRFTRESTTNHPRGSIEHWKQCVT